jgi:hypothetical protein
MSYDAAAESMWAYYKDRKSMYITDIRLYREAIVATLRAGVAPEATFEPYRRPVEDARMLPGRAARG